MLKILLSALLIFPFMVGASEGDFNYRHRTEYKASDYLFQSQGLKKDPVFDEYRTVDLGVNLGVGSDCGRVDFRSTLQASLKNILDSKYFGDMGKDIMAASPMLLTCYFSPTWCAILKHSQVNANFMSQMRLNQCALVDKYVDSRVGDYYEERQSCVHKEIEQNGGNIEAAMQSCNSKRIWDSDIANWSGNRFGEKSSSNKLIESSAKWAGFDSNEGSSVVKLVKNLVGDTVISKGNVSVEYGDKPFALTPRTHLSGIEKNIKEKLCVQLLHRIDENSTRSNIVIRDVDLKDIIGSEDSSLLDRQTLRNLVVMPYKIRSLYCQRLASSIALAKFSEDMNRSLDLLSVASQNPNLPDRRRKEISDKRDALKLSVDATLELQRERNTPLNQVVNQINQEGAVIRADLSESQLKSENNQYESESAKSRFFDCADGIMCSHK